MLDSSNSQVKSSKLSLPCTRAGELESETPSQSVDPELDGNDEDSVAICGLSIKFPQDATSPQAFWEMMIERRCAMTDFPADRLNADGFFTKKSKLNTLPHRGGHFIKEDLAVFDAEFFSISPSEALSMDPMQRWLLEVSYRALENAGISIESVSGSSTAVYTGSFSMDYMLQLTRDPEDPPPYAAVGFGLSMLANRISWFFNLCGPSVGLDSACSSTATAIDVACQSLRDGSTNMAMVAGANLATSPEPYIWMSNVNFLSPDSRCYSFDHRANGYARGEGVGVVILKRLSDAIRDGNTIRAVIRSTGSNEDGRTPGITQPSRTAQEKLIRETYRKAGLSMAHTRYFEAHGTGTPVGDPREAQAIGSAFQKYRSTDDPLYVGALKSNIGHLEGASGLAGLIKAVIVLEKGVIPPNTNFEKVNPKIDLEFLKLKFPEKSHPWPTQGLRRASINSFGYGGSNSHIILDDSYNYMRLRSLHGKHCTVSSPPLVSSQDKSSMTLDKVPSPENGFLRLFVWSTKDKDGISRILKTYQDGEFAKGLAENRDNSFLANLAYTLDSHRSQFQWRAFSLLRSLEDFGDLKSRMSPPLKVHAATPRLGFVFSGQGAQWFAMGRELLCYASYKAELKAAGSYIESLGSRWSVAEEFLKTEDTSNVENAEFSQTLCTILQVALVSLLRTFNIRPVAVVGHSSGEIAAAYAAGHLSRESAWKLAYCRGLCSAELATTGSSQPAGAMISVGLSEADVRDTVAAISQEAISFGVSIACINSPSNVTISGEEHLIDRLKAQYDEQKVFVRKLRVPLAYHSRQMEQIADKYISMIGCISRPNGDDSQITVPMISTVTGQHVEPARLVDTKYWAQNLVSPVQFSRAVSSMCAQSVTSLVKRIDKSHVFAIVVDHLLEIGPHAALQGPLKQILQSEPRGNSIAYNSVLRRGKSAVETMLNTLGELYCRGVEVKLRVVNERSQEIKSSRSLLVNLPEYPFDHNQRFWHESRLSRNYRLRENAPSEFLGVPSRDWNPKDARWRHFIRTAEMPWTGQHVVNGTILYPATGMLVMAIEAAKQLTDRSMDVAGYTLRDVHIEGPINLSANAGSLEVQTSLRDRQDGSQTGPTFEFVIRSYNKGAWLVNCHGLISLDVQDQENKWKREKAITLKQELADKLKQHLGRCQTPVNTQVMYSFLKQVGYEYGPLFQTALDQRCNEETKQATAEVTLSTASEEPHVVHPISLDVILHLCFTAFSLGGRQPMATSIPTAIKSLWVSSHGLSSPEQQTVTSCVTITDTTRRGFTCAGGALAASCGLRLWYEGLELTNVTSKPPSLELPNPEQWCMNIDAKVSLDKLTLEETKSILDGIHPRKQDLEGFFRDLELLVEASLEMLVRFVDPTTFSGQVEWKSRYFAWAEYHLSLRRRHNLATGCVRMDEMGLQKLRDRLSNASHVGRLYTTVMSNLVAIFKGEANPLELLMKTNLLKDYYEELAKYRNTVQAASYIDLLAHQTPGLKLLEVGGGTASATRPIISALRAGLQGSEASSLRCSRYDFTDISSAFLEDARREFSAFHSQMTFGILDIEKSFGEQGFEEGTYDVIVADDVLHATSDVGAALNNVRKALKPGGKLIMTEVLKPDGWTVGFVFGVFPGWWLAVDKEKHLLSPNLTAEDWNTILNASGFSGTDLIFRDFDDDNSHQLGSIVATANPAPAVATVQPKGDMIIVTDQTCVEQQSLAEDLLCQLRGVIQEEVQVRSIEEAFSSSKKLIAIPFVVFLADYGPSFLKSLDETKWKYLQVMVQNSSKILWVSAGGGKTSHPDYGLIDGLARTLRSEYYELHLVTLALDIDKPDNKAERHLVRLIREMLSRESRAPYEQEYVEIDGHLHTRRLTEARYLKLDMDAKIIPFQTVATMVGQARFEMAATSVNGHDDDPHYVELPPTRSDVDELGGNHVEISVKAVSLQPIDRANILGHSTSNTSMRPRIGSYCSGVVIRAGRDSRLHAGDRVIAVAAQIGSTGLYRSHIQVPSTSAAPIGTHLSFSDACWVIPPRLTAYKAIVEVGNARTSDTILVHDGTSLLGQAALRLLADRSIVGAWTTASNDSEADWIVQNLWISPERILPKDWFTNTGSTMLASQWKNSFDIVLCTVTDSHISQSVDPGCVRSGGKFVVVCNASAASNSAQHTYSVAPGVLLSMIHPELVIPTPESFKYATSVPEAATRSIAMNRVIGYEAADLTNIFAHLQTVNENETIVVNLTESSIVNIRKTKSIGPSIQASGNAIIDAAATYVIAGGLGGLGRSMAQWLARHGARYLLLLSRSGPKTTTAKRFVADLESQGVSIEAPICDITDVAMLRKVLASCSERMPPIKGCIQSTMVVVEGLFSERSFSDWKTTVDPKVAGSWNLHTELPAGLDFFVLISSMMGIIGGASLAAYNAGNTYKDALAHYRVSRGERAVSLNLGPIPDAGYLVRNNRNTPGIGLLATKKYVVSYVRDIYALLEIFCDPQSPLPQNHVGCQLVVGIRPPSHWKHLEEVPQTYFQPFWGHMHHVPMLPDPDRAENGEHVTSGSGSADRNRLLDILERLKAAPSLAEGAELVSKALAQRVSVILGMSEDRVDEHKPMHSYGLDSLSAIDVRSWIGNVFDVDMPVFDLLRGATFASAGLTIAQKIRM